LIYGRIYGQIMAVFSKPVGDLATVSDKEWEIVGLG
jgi:hypothetical protein